MLLFAISSLLPYSEDIIVNVLKEYVRCFCATNILVDNVMVKMIIIFVTSIGLILTNVKMYFLKSKLF